MKRALLAEDDPVSRSFLREAMALDGWEVEAFESGESAAAAAIARRFDVLVLDVNLPGEDGIATLRRIRNRDEHASADAPALALTADHRDEQHRRLRRAGFDAVATKPLGLDALQAALRDLSSAGAASGDAAPAAIEDLPIWDDAAALPAVGGNAGILAALRGLLLGDLPAQRAVVAADPMSPSAKDTLHRLRAACGFCGAARLAQAAAALEADATPEALAQFQREAELVLGSPWEKTAAAAPQSDASSRTS